jgi:hypothetical protein
MGKEAGRCKPYAQEAGAWDLPNLDTHFRETQQIEVAKLFFYKAGQGWPATARGIRFDSKTASFERGRAI